MNLLDLLEMLLAGRLNDSFLEACRLRNLADLLKKGFFPDVELFTGRPESLETLKALLRNRQS